MNQPEPNWETVRLPLRRNRMPANGQVDLWLVDLEDLPLEAGPTGLTRKEKVLKKRIQQQFVLRLLLGSYLGKPGKEIRIERSPSGKPSVSNSTLEFNLSHSGSWLAIAVTTGHPIGLDIETNRPMRRPAELARRYFSAAEANAIENLDEPECSRQFLAQWTAREALIKAADSTLAESLSQLKLSMPPIEILTLPSSWPEPGQWRLVKPTTPADLIVHCAVPALIHQVNGFFIQHQS